MVLKSLEIHFCRLAFTIMFTMLGINSKAQSVQGKTIQFNHFSTDHNLSQAVFQAILQDRKGYMWFGTGQGLIKYDGYSFTNFQFDPNNENSLPDNGVSQLCEDSSGNIWISAFSYPLLSKYNQQSEKFTAYRHNNQNKFAGPPGVVTCLLTDKQGRLWIGSGNGLSYYEASTDRIVDFSNLIFPDTLCSRNIQCLMLDHNGLLWIGTNNGINIYTHGSKRLKLFIFKDNNELAAPSVDNLMEDHSGDIWMVIKQKGISRYNSVSGSLKKYHHNSNDPNSVGSDFVNSLFEDSKFNIWAGTYEGGLSIYQPYFDNFKTYRANINSAHSLSSDQILAIFEDHSGVLWIGTNGGGLNNCFMADSKFIIYQNWDKEYQSHFPLSLKKGNSGKIYMTTFGRGIQEFDPLTGKFRPFEIKFPNPKNPANNYFYDSFEASDGYVYMVGFNSGFYKVSLNTRTFMAIIPEGYYPDTTFGNIFYCITEDKSKRLWIGTNSGLKCYDMRLNKFSDFANLFPDTNNLSKDGVVNLYCDKEGILWIAGENGLILLNTLTGHIKIFKHIVGHSESISNSTINCFYHDGKDAIWVGTNGGLNRFDIKKERFTAYSVTDGLPGNSIAGILPDEHGNLWVSTNNGLCKFTPSSIKNGKPVCRNYNISDGLPSNEFYYNTSITGRDGRLYFGSVGGLVSFNPEELKDNKVAPSVVITDFSVLNKTIAPNDSTAILKFPIDETKEIKLSYRYNVFSFTFSALNYVHPEKNKYAYKLENFDKEWIFTDASRRFAYYTNLDAGEYTFRVKGSNNDGYWNEEGTSVKLIITPPFWKTGWFKLFCALSGFSILYFIYISRKQKIREIQRIRNRIASDLHDDLGATLSSISIMSELVNQQVKDQVPQASKLLDKIGSSSRNMIESVNDMVWAINPQNDSFENIIKRMRTFAAEILSAKDIFFHFDFDNNLLQSKLKMDIRRNFYLIFKEAINNIAKYSHAENAFVMIWNRDENLKMTIRDDGDGFDPDLVKEGNGLINMQQRAENMMAKFVLESVAGKGTIIEVEFKNARP